jgi:hypothetical protein
MTFSTIKLTGSRVLVRGRDITGTEGECTISSAQWDELNARTDVDRAQQAFDEAVQEFFAPLTEAAEKAHRSLEVPEDSTSYVVLDEGSEGEARRPRQVVKLSRDSVILRLIEEGNTDRLIWVNDQLEVTEASVASTPSAPAAAPETNVEG